MRKKFKFTRQTFAISIILILSAILNFANIGIEGYGNGYYAAGVKSMTMSLKNFFFVSFDPSGFVTIDKPPLGFMIQAISAKIFGFSGWSILLPEALAGVISVGLLYYLVKKSFGNVAGLIAALCLAITPVFVAVSRNNTIDNLLVMTLLFACWAISIAAEKGKIKYLIISLALVGVGFNIKMLQAYMIAPALYITYLLSSATSLKKRILHLAAGTVILLVVSFSWAVIVDLVPAADRPFIGSSTNNSVMELILGHNGMERLGLSSSTSGPGSGAPGGGQKMDGQSQRNDGQGSGQPGNFQGGNGQNQGQTQSGTDASTGATQNENGQQAPGGAPGANGQSQDGMRNRDGMQPPNGGGFGGGSGGGLSGSFGGQTKSGITRLFSKNVLSDQIVWFLPLAIFGFIAAAVKEKLKIKLDNKRKQSLVLWFMWLLPEFIYFSYTTGLFHPYYLTMLAPPIAALTGIGLSAMWELHKEGGLKSWILPISLIANAATQALMLSYFNSITGIVKIVMMAALALSFISSVALCIVNLLKNKAIKFKQILAGAAFAGLLVIPAVGSFAAITHSVNSTIPSGGLELLSSSTSGGQGMGGPGMDSANNSNTKLIEFLKSHVTNEKYALVVSSSQSADNLIIQSGEPVMALGGFSGSDNILTLDEFKEMVNKGEVRYVMVGGMGNGQSSEIMKWVEENGKAVDESEWKNTAGVNNQSSDTNSSSQKTSNSIGQRDGGFGGGNSEQLYDLKTNAEAK